MSVWSKWLESLDYEYIILPTCTRHLSIRSTCEKCVNVCIEKAISIINNKPMIERDKCIECGKCIAACPVQAVAGIYPKRKIIHNQLVAKGEHSPTQKELLILYKKGINTIIAETESILESWQNQIDEVNQILIKIGEEPFSIIMESVNEITYASRRELFFLWKAQGKSAINEIVPATWRFNYQDMDLSKYYKNIQFTKITIDQDKCTLCHVCEELCRKNCFNNRKEFFVLNSQGCENCQLCQDACPESAITIEAVISKAEETILPIYEKTCTSCQKTYYTLSEEDEKCVVCTKKEKILRRKERARTHLSFGN
ncbi:4Fe-4S dicluster domain-containing protein [Robertmurraya massiliosenegalensis]|uniref:4Fe-4S dicluster domain-containing protein n=1 Tax=Robertmurraya TaxID=2837507 RepID=UPI0039A4D2CF